jgi:hypothetical protein
MACRNEKTQNGCRQRLDRPLWIPKSVTKALGLDLSGVLPNDDSPPEVHWEQLIAINRKNQEEQQAGDG